MPRPRARDLGIPFRGDPGPLNAITDVPGLEVGATTLIEGTDVRTGVTVICPRGRANPDDPCVAGWYSLNGNGEMTGTTWVEEFGAVSLPIAITNTHSVGTAHEAIIDWVNARHPELASMWALPVSAETWDGYLNDINGHHLKAHHVAAAIDSASGARPLEGGVGGGTGMNCYAFKGGSGTSSRVVEHGRDRYTVGVFVQANFGSRDELTIAGVPVGLDLLDDNPYGDSSWLAPPGAGSVIVIVATDAPLLPGQCKALARRVPLGLARTGTTGSHFSGDIFLALSTANPRTLQSELNEAEATDPGYSELRFVPWPQIDPFFRAVVEATEEAVVNVLCAGETMIGFQGHRSPGMPVERVCELLAARGRLHA